MSNKKMNKNKKKACCTERYKISSSNIIREDQIPIVYSQNTNVLQIDSDDEELEKTMAFKERIEYDREPLPVYQQKWCIQPSILYTYTEELDPLARLRNMKDDKSETTYKMIDYNMGKYDPYMIQDIHEQYLKTPAVNFFIFGKSDMEEVALGKLLAEYWNCVYVDPEGVLLEEIRSNSIYGLWIDNNLRLGQSIGSEVYMSLVEKKIKSDVCVHHGYILVGLPVISNDMFRTEEQLFTESFMDFRANFLKDANDSLHGEEDDIETLTNIDSQDILKYVQSKKDIVFNRTQHFNVLINIQEYTRQICNWIKTNSVIIYIQCPIKEVLVKRDKDRFNVHTGFSINLSQLTDDSVPANLEILDRDHIKHLVKLFRNEPYNVRDEVDHFNDYVRPTIDRTILAHDQQFVIKLDGRLNVNSNFRIVRDKLRMLPLQQVILAEKFSDLMLKNAPDVDDVIDEMAEGVGEEEDLFEGRSMDEILTILQNKFTIGMKYRWLLSDWGTLCPVALKAGRAVDGNSRNAVRFMNRIFFLEDDAAATQFCKNPRKFLLPPNPQPPMKVVLVGVKDSGIIDVANCLGYIFDAKVIDVEKLIEHYRQDTIAKRVQDVKDQLTEEVIDERHQQLQIEWDVKNEARENKKIDWRMHILNHYLYYLSLLSRNTKSLHQLQTIELSIDSEDVDLYEASSVESVQVSPPVPSTIDQLRFAEPNRRSDNSSTSSSSISSTRIVRADDIEKNIIAKAIENIQSEMVPVEIDFIKAAINDQTLLDPYLPLVYQPLPFPKRPMKDEAIMKDVEKRFLQFTIDTNVTITKQTITDLVVEQIKQIETERQKPGGWIVSNLNSIRILKGMYNNGIEVDEVFHFSNDNPNTIYKMERYRKKRFAEYFFMKSFLDAHGFIEAYKRCPPPTNLSQLALYIAEDILDLILKADRFDYADQWRYMPSHLGEGGEEGEEEPPEEESTAEESEHVVEEGEEVQETESQRFHREYLEIESLWHSIKNFFDDKPTVQYNVNIVQPIENIMLDSIQLLISRYRIKAKEFDENERALEYLELGPAMGSGEGEEGGTAGDDEEEKPSRKYGDANKFCPVALIRHNVLWEGKNDFTAIYDNKLYLMSNSAAFNEFMDNPRKFIPLRNPILSLPPLRLCITGPIGSGKTTLAKQLAIKLGLTYIDYIDMINSYYTDAHIKLGRKQKKLIIEPVEAEQRAFDQLESNVIEFNKRIEEYYNNGSELPARIQHAILDRFWRDPPWKQTGIVIDGFPHCDNDFTFMIENYIIPDLIIQLQVNETIVEDRMLRKMIDQWQEEMSQAQYEKEQQNMKVILEWEEERNKLYKRIYGHLEYMRIVDALVKGEIVLRNISDDTMEQVKMLRLLGEDDYDPEAIPSIPDKLINLAKEQIDFEPEHLETDRKLEKEFPPPQFQDEWESQEDAEQRIQELIQEYYQSEVALGENFQEHAKTNLIPFCVENARKTPEKLLLAIIYRLNPLKYRNRSFFEVTYTTSIDEALQLIKCGYYFLSKFGYTCPLQTHCMESTVQMYLTKLILDEDDGDGITPVIHRQYIYFLRCPDDAKTFRNNPLRYIWETQGSFPLHPLRLAVIGPPKSGKTTLAKRFEKELGLKMISCGAAIRFVLQEVSHSLLACLIDAQLRSGRALDPFLVIKAVELFSLDGGQIQGIIFDGFPTSDDDMKGLFNCGLVPQKIIYMNAPFKFSWMCLSKMDAEEFCRPKFSQKLLKHRFFRWFLNRNDLINLLKKDYQNMCAIDCRNTKWYNWDKASTAAITAHKKLINYKLKFNETQLIHLDSLCINHQEFVQNQSDYANYCPLCWLLLKELNRSTCPPQTQQTYQYTDKFYFICSQHVTKFIEAPEFILVDDNDEKKKLPKKLPCRIYNVTDFEMKVKYQEKLKHRGYCIVCYVRNGIKHTLIQGTKTFFVQYDDANWIFCSEACLEVFMRKPSIYCTWHILFKETVDIPRVDVNALPIKGYLRQTTSPLLTEVCTNAGYWRIKYPKLSPHISAAINIGLLLKIRNPKTSPNELNLYKNYYKKFLDRCELLKQYFNIPKLFTNPYLEIPFSEHSKFQIAFLAMNKATDDMSKSTISFGSREVGGDGKSIITISMASDLYQVISTLQSDSTTYRSQENVEDKDSGKT